jgi:hypothetical protein
MVIVTHHVLYYFNTTKLLEATCRLMVVVPWSLLYITDPFQFWVEVFPTTSF